MGAQVDQQHYYRDYYLRKGADRNDIRTNPGVLFQALSWEACAIRAIRSIDCDPADAQILDVGCGSGDDIFLLLRMRFDPVNITGIDIHPVRIAQARGLFPQITLVHGDAASMEFDDCAFDLCFESTMFATLTDDAVSARIAAEMIRVCKPGGHILLVDWRTPKPGDSSYKALDRRRLSALFGIGRETRLLRTFGGALVPPVGRWLSAHLPSCYFLVSSLTPFLVGQAAVVLQKQSR